MKTYIIREKIGDLYYVSQRPPKNKVFKVREYDTLEEAASMAESFNIRLRKEPANLDEMLEAIGPSDASLALNRRPSDGSRMLIGRNVTAEQVKKGRKEPGGLRGAARKIQKIAQYAGYRITVERL